MWTFNTASNKDRELPSNDFKSPGITLKLTKRSSFHKKNSTDPNHVFQRSPFLHFDHKLYPYVSEGSKSTGLLISP